MATPYRSADARAGHRVPSLSWAWRRQALRLMGLALLALVLGAAAAIGGTMVGMAWCGAILALPLALVGIVVSVMSLVDPIPRTLGANRAMRRAALQEIEEELASPTTERIELAAGAVFFSPNWFCIVDSRAAELEPRSALVSFWTSEEQRRIAIIPIGMRRWLHFAVKTAAAEARVISLPFRAGDQPALDALKKVLPYGAPWAR